MARAEEAVRRLWTAFAAHDWEAAAASLAEDFVCEWPQTGERFVGRANFLAMNRNHPAPNWRIDRVEVLPIPPDRAVARVIVPTDLAVDVCLGLYRVDGDGLLLRATEYWTEHRHVPTPDWRAPWTDPASPSSR